MTKKRIILLLDGTWNDADDAGADTNIVRLRQKISAHLLSANARTESQVTSPTAVAQQTYVMTGQKEGGLENVILYERGVGTGGFLDRIGGGAFGVGLSNNVRRAYTFLAQHYEDGDEIYIFGFSRGSYTARSLVGCLGAIGIAERAKFDAQALSRLWAYYRTHPADRLPFDAAKVGEFSTGPGTVPVKLLAVFDTVGALGVPLNVFWRENRDLYGFHDVDLSDICENSLHAVAIDEHREAFEATLWRQLPFAAKKENVRQVWFAGAHADVGGGSIPGERSAQGFLDDITLDWMIRHVMEIGGSDFPLDAPLPQLPDQIQRDCAAAPQREPRQGVYRLMPYVYRSINNEPVPVAPLPFERNVSIDRHAKPIGEGIHISAIDRLGQTVRINGTDTTYAPRNLIAALQPLISATAVAEDGIDLIGWDNKPLDRHVAWQCIQDGLRRVMPDRF